MDAVETILGRLTLEQKASLTSGGDFWHTQAVPDAGVPDVMVTDGPNGLRKQSGSGDAMALGGSDPATCFPPAVTLGCTWDVGLARRVGEAIGAEALAADVAVVLGPGVNIKRSPLCGRNFEYVSEDPFLSGRMGAAWVAGVQSRGVGTSLKHYAANNQETDRLRVSADVDERTLREVYLPAFEHVVRQEQPTTVMCAYNKVNGTHASEHHWLLTEVLRQEWGFAGMVVSDWGAVSNRVAALAAGLDLEMPPSGTDQEVVDAVRSGELPEEVLDEAVRRVLTLVAREQSLPEERPGPDLDAHHALAREVAAAGAVLLRNEDGILPLAADGTEVLAVIGELARTPRYQGAGSSQVVPTRLDAALEAIRALAGEERVRFAPGYTLDGPVDPALADEAVAAAREAGTVLLFLGLPPSAESEGFDRPDIALPPEQLALLRAVRAVNERVVVVLAHGGLVSVAGWEDQAAAVLDGWLGGQAGGSAMADLLFGRANPSGRLTETVPLRLEDTPSWLFFPGGEQHVRYGEGIYVGYRYHQTLGAPVAHPFGFGLSYSTFALADLVVRRTGPNAAEVSATVTNTGPVAGSEVVQVYVHDRVASVDRPEHELKGFAKVHLEPGASDTVVVPLEPDAFRFWSPGRRRWVVEAGEVEVRVGTSCADIHLVEVLDLEGDGVLPEVDASSTLDEWLAHPVGGPALRQALAQGGGRDLDGVDPHERAILGAMPLGKLSAFGLGVPRAAVDALVDAVRAERDVPRG
ncbi:glycoside hydrolase family 3 C-terminal domain-containing protein [Oryzihumus sp.]|uniref:glycoside hydrolase family 3 C-terminal domain-containing protein n=1 Tax=Oryzihumus sp. TaxID=1968903 RepID=UPI002ED77F83